MRKKEKNRLKNWKESRNKILLAIFSFLSRSLQQISTFVVTLLAARFLSPAEYGIYSLGIVFISLIQTLTYTGFYHFIVTSKLDDKVVLDSSFWMIFGLASGSAILLMLTAVPISNVYAAEELSTVIVFLAAIQPIAGINAWYSATLLRREALNLHFSVMFSQNMLALISGIFLLLTWKSLYALVAFRYARVIIGFLLYLSLARQLPGRHFDRSVAKQAIGFSGGLYGARFMTFLSQYAADLLLGFFYTVAEAGLYRFGNRMASGGIDIVANPMRSFALTQFGSRARSAEDLAGPLSRFVGSITLLTGLVASVIIVLAPKIVADFFDPAYMAALVVTYALSVRAVTMVGTTVLEPVMAACNQTNIVMWFTSIWTSLTVATIFLAAPFGLEILAWSQAGVATLASVSALKVIHLKSKISVAGAFRNLVVAIALVLIFCIALYVGWHSFVQSLMTGFNDVLTVGAGFVFATVLSAVTLFFGARLKVFSLSVFAG
ncbi:oligosaccharide flippase family protein [Roseibium sp.]|uniref:oligosaccharide flippase family protein n=1 Tax=Roseibium sp. TaxID=1936156 RepID=UPI003B5008E6